MLKYLTLLFCMVSSVSYAGESKFILMLGPSGAGKSTLIQHLMKMDPRFVYVSPYTTRDLRPGEKDKIHVDLETIKKLDDEGMLLTVNQIYGIYYATPKDVIDKALADDMYPILDWPVDKMDVIELNYKDHFFSIYVEPESLDQLEWRLGLDGRDKDGKRFAAGKAELERYYAGIYDSLINLKVVNESGRSEEIATLVFQKLEFQ